MFCTLSSINATTCRISCGLEMAFHFTLNSEFDTTRRALILILPLRLSLNINELLPTIAYTYMYSIIQRKSAKFDGGFWRIGKFQYT